MSITRLVLYSACSLLLFANALCNIRMGIVTNSAFYGETELGYRIKQAAEELGWTVFLDGSNGHNFHVESLDWVICLRMDNRYIKKNCPVYLAVLYPYPDKNIPSYKKYDGYLLTINPDYLKDFFSKLKGKPFHMLFYPTVQNVEYKRLELNDLATMMPIWGDRFNSAKYKTLYQLLSASGKVKFYGLY